MGPTSTDTNNQPRVLPDQSQAWPSAGSTNPNTNKQPRTLPGQSQAWPGQENVQEIASIKVPAVYTEYCASGINCGLRKINAAEARKLSIAELQNVYVDVITNASEANCAHDSVRRGACAPKVKRMKLIFDLKQRESGFPSTFQ